jgi:hypothetical protein
VRVCRPFAIAFAVAATAATFVLPAHADLKPKLTTRIAEAITGTWTCQNQLGVPRTRARDPWVPHSRSFREAELGRWTARRAQCFAVLHERAAIWRRLHDGIAAYYRTQGYASGPLTGAERAIEAAGRRYGVSPFFMVAASVTESSAGLAACHPNTRNIWGLASCSSHWGSTPVPTWATWGEAFDWYARFLTGRTPVSSGWPGARTTYDFTGYAACSSCWGSATAAHLASMFGITDASARYPAALT